MVAHPSRHAVDVCAAAHALPAGAALSTDAIQLRRVSLEGRTPFLFTRGDESRLRPMRAAHDLPAGQLIQRGDVMVATSFADRRLVFIPLSAVPPTPARARCDLLLIAGSAAHPSVVPFSLGVEVEASVSGGLVLAVPATEAAAFVFAAADTHLAAVVADPGATDGTEAPISSIEDPISGVAGR